MKTIPHLRWLAGSVSSLWILAILTLTSPARADEGILQNNDFERPELAPLTSWEKDAPMLPSKWRIFSSEMDAARVPVTNEFSFSGKQCVVFVAPSMNEFHAGIAQEVEVTASQTYRYQLRVKGMAKHPLRGKARGQISIEWVDGTGHETARTWGPTWGGADIKDDDWKLFQGDVIAPADAVKANFVITCFSGVDSDGAFAVDAAVLLPIK